MASAQVVLIEFEIAASAHYPSGLRSSPRYQDTDAELKTSSSSRGYQRLIDEVDQAMRQCRGLAETWRETIAFGEATRKARAEGANGLYRFVADRAGGFGVSDLGRLLVSIMNRYEEWDLSPGPWLARGGTC